ncbi:MAG: DNA polymerase III subunit epsilon [Atopobiaceae bacterium]|nr:DNA polymerase III subunit epsilon [Atopobiaceae bacterium]
MTDTVSSLTIDDIILPGTPAHIRERYASLAARSREARFGLLEEDVVMLDTETTGLSYRKNELIEIAAARLSGGAVVERFQTFVHPTGPIPREIVSLTGIRDVDVTDAPSAIDAVGMLADFVGGMPVVAHNATFDRSFVEGAAQGFEVSDTWIDSLALSRIALPRLKTHRLSDMAMAFGCESVTHRAMDDVDALCGLWRILLVALSDLPDGLLEHLASMHDEVEWAYRPLFAYLAQRNPGARFSLLSERRTLGGLRDGRRREDAMEIPLHAPTPEAIHAAFGADGLVSSLYDSYELRDEQLAMAQQVRDALATSTHRCLEAGTGVGKSMAYLVPEVMFAQANDVTVGIATKTNALADQLVSHELPALANALPSGVTYVSLKGCERYPCMRRLELAARGTLPTGAEENAEDVLTAIAVTYAFACQSIDGDLDALGIRWRAVPRELLATTSNECLRRGCPYYPRGCFVHGARMAASCADVVVTNHSLLLRDIDAENAILPPIRHWVVDEAHSFDAEARRQWAHEVLGDEIRRALQQLGGLERGLIQSIITKGSHMDAATLVAGLMAKAASWVQRTSDASIELFEAIHGLSMVAGFGGYESTTLWIDEGLRQSAEWHAVEDASAKLLPLLDETVKVLDAAREALAPEDAQSASELQDPLRRLRAFQSSLRIIVLEPDTAYVYSAELFRGRRRVGDRLVAELLEVGPALANKWYPETKSVVYTSATMAVGDSFEHFEHGVGLDLLPAEKHLNARLESSYDFDANMSVIVTRDLPEPNDRRYLAALEDLLFDVHCGMDGSVLTLFTNRREMERVYEGLRPRLALRGLDLACQQRGSSPRRLRERFVSERKLSLFALKSFWEGFDAAGDTLRCVVVCKLPFASPREPLVRERELRDRRAWWRYSLPEAALEVKQAAGRLIRSSSDTGVFILADGRISTKRYGNTFISTLPSHNCITLETQNVARYLALWRASHE